MKSTISMFSEKCFATILLFFFSCNLMAQENAGQLTYDTDLPKVTSCDCDSSLEKCTGTIVWEDGSRYEGAFVYGKIEGKGRLELPDGSFYEGEFMDKTFHGQGKMVYEDGSTYIGDWSLGYREGEGSLVYPDGSEYLGEFESDAIHGEGSMILSSGESYTGNWEYGQTNGFGKINRLDGSVYLGMNKEGSRHGSGMVVWETGDTLHGSWQDGKMAEEGVFQFGDGSTMISFWDNGVMQEENVYIKADGDRYAASSDKLAAEVLQNSWEDMESIERNFGMAFYAIGMEYKSMMDFDRAIENLQYAAQFSEQTENLFLHEMVESQMANINTEKQNSGVAKKEDKED